MALLQRVISNDLMPVLAALNNCALKERPSHEPEAPRLITTPLAKAIEDEIAKADVKSTERFAMEVQRSNLVRFFFGSPHRMMRELAISSYFYGAWHGIEAIYWTMQSHLSQPLAR